MKKRKKLGAEELYREIGTVFDRVPEERRHLGNVSISIRDSLFSGLAIFAMKFGSLLKFDKASKDNKRGKNLKSIFSLKSIPSDTRMREILDGIDPVFIRKTFTKIFSKLQRFDILNRFKFLGGRFLISLDGSGHFSSSKIRCENCIKKVRRTGGIGYYHQMLGAAVVHPDMRQVIPLCPEPILNQDGSDKQDSERKASIRWIKSFRKEHYRLKACILEDALAANAPHIKFLRENALQFIIGIKENGNKVLFHQLDDGEKTESVSKYQTEEIRGIKVKKRIVHEYRYLNGASLNGKNKDIKVNVLDYREKTYFVDPTQDKKGIGVQEKRFSWITDFHITKANISLIRRAGRRRWAIENETFRTLKETTGYTIEHSYGHGEKYLCTMFSVLAFLAFLVDQAPEITCPLFRKALKKRSGTKMYLWESMKSALEWVLFQNVEQFFQTLAGELEVKGVLIKAVAANDTS